MRVPWVYVVLTIAGSAQTQPLVVPGDQRGDAYQAGFALFQRGEYESARMALLGALAEAQQRVPKDQALPVTLHTLGVVEGKLGRYADARPHLEAALNLWSASGDNGRQMAITLEALGYLLSDAGEWVAADERLRAAIEVRERVYGVSSGEVAAALGRMAEIFLRRGQLQRARSLLDQALAIERQSLLPDDLSLLTTQVGLAHALRGLGDLNAAHARAAEAEAAGRQSPIYPEILGILGDLYRLEGESAKAVPLLRRAIALAAARNSDRELPAAVMSLAHVDAAQGRLASARDGFERGIAMMECSWGAGAPEIASAQVGLASVMLEQGKLERASALIDAARPLLDSAYSEDHLFRAMELVVRSAVAAARGDRDRAAEALLWAMAAIERQEPRNQVGLWETYSRLLKPYRPDLARDAGKRGRALARSAANRTSEPISR